MNISPYAERRLQIMMVDDTDCSFVDSETEKLKALHTATEDRCWRR